MVLVTILVLVSCLKSLYSIYTVFDVQLWYAFIITVFAMDDFESPSRLLGDHRSAFGTK